MPAHNHNVIPFEEAGFDVGNPGEGDGGRFCYGDNYPYQGNVVDVSTTNVGGNQGHTHTTDRPSYFVLAYIMKL
jgi:hypothetical protein